MKISQRGVFTGPVDPTINHSELLAVGLRKINPSYNGPAMRIRRDSDNAVMDVGFNPDGTLNTDTIVNFISPGILTSNKAGDIGTPEGVYSLRKAVTSYNGPAIQVSDYNGNYRIDVGFDTDGNLDLAKLQEYLNDFGYFRNVTRRYRAGTDNIVLDANNKSIYTMSFTGLDGSSGGVIAAFGLANGKGMYLGFRNDGTFVAFVNTQGVNPGDTIPANASYTIIPNGADIIKGDGTLVVM